MEASIHSLPTHFNNFHDYLLASQRPLSKDLQFITPKYLLSFLSAFFLLFILGRYVMNHSHKLNIRYLLIVHSFALAALYGYIFVGIISEVLTKDIKLVGSLLTFEGASKPMIDLYWHFYIAKALAFFSLIVRVLQKKRISVLSVFFCVGNLLWTWATVFHYPSNVAYFPILVNSGVYTIIYTCLVVFHVFNGIEVFPTDFWRFFALHNLSLLLYSAYVLTFRNIDPNDLMAVYITGFAVYMLIALAPLSWGSQLESVGVDANKKTQ